MSRSRVPLGTREQPIPDGRWRASSSRTRRPATPTPPSPRSPSRMLWSPFPRMACRAVSVQQLWNLGPKRCCVVACSVPVLNYWKNVRDNGRTALRRLRRSTSDVLSRGHRPGTFEALVRGDALMGPSDEPANVAGGPSSTGVKALRPAASPVEASPVEQDTPPRARRRPRPRSTSRRHRRSQRAGPVPRDRPFSVGHHGRPPSG